MKKIFFFCFLFFSIIVFSQEKPKDLDFDTTFVDTENQYIVMPITPEKTDFVFGVSYYDFSTGYSFRYLGEFKVEKEKYVKVQKKEEEKPSFWIYRWENLGLKVAILPKNRVEELGLEYPPSFLKDYVSDDPIEEQIVDKASSMNGAGFSDLALSPLEKLNQENYKSEKLFFELAFAYNAIGKFSEAERVLEKAINNGFLTDLIRKEYIFSLIYQNQLDRAEKFLFANLDRYEDESYKAESIINFIVSSNRQNKKEKAKKWLNIFKEEIKDKRYDSHLTKLEKMINNNDSTP